MWTEKYRPKNLEEVIGQKEVTIRLEAFVKSDSMPHFLFAGPAGVGKTSAALALAHEVFGKDLRQSFLELNASDERGIKVVRSQIKEYAKLAPVAGQKFRLIMLDEADNMTSAAQQALRRTMETHGRNCRFILVGNYSSNIIAPIQSRCAIFRFKRLKEEDIEKAIANIAVKEDLKLGEGAIKALINISEGDMRQVLNILQAAAALGQEITEDLLYEVSGQARPAEVKELLDTAVMKQDFREARTKLRNLLYESGLSGKDVLKQLHSITVQSDYPEDLKITLLRAIGEADVRLTQGANEEIQLAALTAEMILLGSK